MTNLAIFNSTNGWSHTGWVFNTEVQNQEPMSIHRTSGFSFLRAQSGHTQYSLTITFILLLFCFQINKLCIKKRNYTIEVYDMLWLRSLDLTILHTGVSFSLNFLESVEVSEIIMIDFYCACLQVQGKLYDINLTYKHDVLKRYINSGAFSKSFSILHVCITAFLPVRVI